MDKFPTSIVIHIMTFLDTCSLNNLDLVSKKYKKLSESNVIWTIRMINKFPWIKSESLLTDPNDRQSFYESIIELISKVKEFIKDEEPDVNEMSSMDYDLNGNLIHIGVFIIDKPPYYFDLVNSFSWGQTIKPKYHYTVTIEEDGVHLRKCIDIVTGPVKANKILRMGSYRELKSRYLSIDKDLYEFGLKVGYLSNE